MFDGWLRTTKHLYGIGAHYLRTPIEAPTELNPARPNVLLFDGEGRDAKFAGVSYVLPGDPEGFTGDHDVWHAHAAACVDAETTVSLIEENSSVWLSESECTARGGLVQSTDGVMIHVWIGPEYIDGAPIFAHDHPKLYDGYHPKRDSADWAALATQ
jgi:hypothetical protein